MWTPNEASTLLVYIVFVYWQPSFIQQNNMDNRNWYDAMREKIWCTVPSQVFGIVWAVLFGLITASGYVFLGPTGLGIDSNLYVAAYVVFVVNVLLTKVWYPIFFDTRRSYIGLALFIALLIWLTAISFLVFMAYELAWLPFSLYVPYILWGSYALYLNSRFYFYSSSSSSSSSDKKKKKKYKQLPLDENTDNENLTLMSMKKAVPRNSHRMRQPKKEEKKKTTFNIEV